MRTVSTVVACLIAAVTLAPAASRADDHGAAETACTRAIAAAERRQAMPPRVLGTIAKVESGREIGQKLVPWPWAINVEGVGHFYATKAEAIAAVQNFQAAGRRSIDVGCMQINLAAHPQAFDTLDTAFDPAANASYAARFLRTLTQQTGRLALAMTAYHSHTPEFAADYARRLLAIWPEAAALGLSADLPPPELPSPYTRAFASQLARDKITLPGHKATLVSQLGAASVHGSAWPGRPTTTVSSR
jgi:hypothetical protein